MNLWVTSTTTTTTDLEHTMHIVQSDTTYDDVDHDIDLDCAAEDLVLDHLKVTDLSMHGSNPWRVAQSMEAANQAQFYAFGPNHRA